MHKQALLELRRTARSAMVTRRLAWSAAGATAVSATAGVAGRGAGVGSLRTKRVMDVALTLALLPLAMPLLLACAAAVRLGSPGPALVSRVCTGIGGRRFLTWRLRTEAGADDGTVRTTAVGRFLQCSHLDVLPELLSVLRGDMSLVGPRPATFPAESLPLWYTGRFEVKPGVTGLAQIAAAGSSDPNHAVRLDIAYARTWTPGLDARILARTAVISVGAVGEAGRHAVRRALAAPSVFDGLRSRSAATGARRLLSVPRLVVRALVAVDIAAVGLALALSYGLRFGLQVGSGDPVEAPPPLEYVKLFVVMGAAIAVVAALQQLYRTVPPHTRLEESYAVAKAVTLGTVLALAMAFFYREFNFSRLAMAYFWVIAVVLMASAHLLVRKWLVARHARGLDLSPTIVVGSPSAHLLDRLRGDPAFGLDLIGWLSPNGDAAPGTYAAPEAGVLVRSAKPGEALASVGLPRLGTLHDVPAVLAHSRPERVMIVEHGLTHAQLLETIDACERQDIHVQLIPPIYDLLIDPTDLTFTNGLPALRIDEVRSPLVRRAAKRLLDLVVSASLLLLLAPLLLTIALVIRRTSPGPALFRQVRGGRGGRPFEMLKFRTMTRDAEERLLSVVDIDGLDQPVFKVVNDPRITPVGRWLRRFSLDELPQLLNVLRGDMSLVGPRPEELRLVQKYDIWQRRRLKVKPGITGLQQVIARGHLADLSERVRLDVYYTRKQSLLLDLFILLRTVGAVLSGRGAT